MYLKPPPGANKYTFYLLKGHSCPLLNCDKVRTCCCHRHLLLRWIIIYLCPTETSPCRLLFLRIIRATLLNYSAGQKKKEQEVFFVVLCFLATVRQCTGAEFWENRNSCDFYWCSVSKQQREAAPIINTLILDHLVVSDTMTFLLNRQRIFFVCVYRMGIIFCSL